MFNGRLKTWIKKVPCILFPCLLSFPLTAHASFIESTIGTAVVNDATATLYNPAALTVVKKPQFIGLGTYAYFNSQFTGQAEQRATRFRLIGSAETKTFYYLPSFYLSLPVAKNVTIGFAAIGNDFNRGTEDNSILRYAQSGSHVENIDLVSAIGIKLNECFALGVGLNVSYAQFILRPITGFPSLNIPDSESRNESNATSWGGDIGFLFKPTQSTLIGFNYRSAVTYAMAGTSIFEGSPQIISNDYHFKIWTPARNVLSVNQTVTKKLGIIGTVQYIQWSIFNNINIFQVATRTGILAHALVPHHLHDAWVGTLGTHYRITPKWILRLAASYIETPSTGKFQISNGDSIVLGGSTSYEINKNFTIDGSYAHAFIKDQHIHIVSRNIIDGVNKGSRDSISLKLTFNLC